MSLPSLAEELLDSFELNFLTHDMGLIEFKVCMRQILFPNKIRQAVQVLALGGADLRQTAKMVCDFGIAPAIVMVNENDTSNRVPLCHRTNVRSHRRPILGQSG